MFSKLSFYVQHSPNDMRVNRQRTFFALLCIAAGVAAIVSLQTVALMMGDTLTGNLQQSNRGDISLSIAGVSDADNPNVPYDQGVANGVLVEQPAPVFFTHGGEQPQYRIGKAGIDHLQTWINANYPGQVEMTYPWIVSDFVGVMAGGPGTSVTAVASGVTVAQATPILIDPSVYPFYGKIAAADDTPLSSLMQSPNDIVIDQRLADALGVQVGEMLRVSGANADFTVRAILPTEVEVMDPAADLMVALYGFYYLDHGAIHFFDGIVPQTDTIYLKLSDPAQTAEINASILHAFPYLSTTTIDMLEQNNQALSDKIGQFVSVVGLVSLLLGSIGIVNTMQVIVRRRTVEVAVLKTVGLHANEITSLFLVEAFIMGVIGSIAGVALGWVTTFMIKGVAENLLAQPLPFRIALQPVVNGLIVGSLVTTIFGFLPILAAGQVRPSVVLRPDDSNVRPAGWLRTIPVLAVVILALSGVTRLILGTFETAMTVTLGAFMMAGVLVLLLSLLIWAIGRFVPSFGFIDLRISLQQMQTSRTRGAITLLALVVGVFSLSLITMFAESINNSLASVLDANSGGNVAIALVDRDRIPAVTEVLSKTDGVNGYEVRQTFNATLVSLEQSDGTIFDREQLTVRIAQNSTLGETAAALGGSVEGMDEGEIGLSALEEITVRDAAIPAATPVQIGRVIAGSDVGQPVIVFTNSGDIENAELQVGDKLTYAFGEGTMAQTITFTLIGIAQQPVVSSVMGGNGINIPTDALPEAIRPDEIQISASVVEDHVADLRRNLSDIAGVFMLETAVLSRMIASLLATFSAFPTMVALLGLTVGEVVIANSVALTTMDRRREIAMMKAIGLQRNRVLGMLLLENGLMGLIGGLICVALGLVILTMLLSVSGGSTGAIPYSTALTLMLISVLIALFAAMTTAWHASGEKPLQVLRYE